jgi:hypothetical protein
MFNFHVDHVQTHIERVRYGHLVDPSPESVYLGAEDDGHFWELVGLRLAGCPVVVLALLRFQRRELPGIAYARESLSTYLSALPLPGFEDEADALTAILPPHDQRISFFLKRLRAGLRPSPVNLDPARIQVAFDFRLHNPTLVTDFRDEAEPLRDHYYRTVGGHLLRGRSHQVPAAAPQESHRFVAISAPEQIMPSGVYPLPTLFVNRRYLALRIQARSREEMAAVMKLVPFVPASATAESILPLDAGRAGERATVGSEEGSAG